MEKKGLRKVAVLKTRIFETYGAKKVSKSYNPPHTNTHKKEGICFVCFNYVRIYCRNQIFCDGSTNITFNDSYSIVTYLQKSWLVLPAFHAPAPELFYAAPASITSQSSSLIRPIASSSVTCDQPKDTKKS